MRQGTMGQPKIRSLKRLDQLESLKTSLLGKRELERFQSPREREQIQMVLAMSPKARKRLRMDRMAEALR